MTKIYKVCLALIVTIMSTQANAQYYLLNFPNEGNNPGKINEDAEYPSGGGLPTGWSTIMGPTYTTPTWSTTRSLPVGFSFSFNGVAVTQYKVASSGIVTFDINTALAAPTYTKGTLPNAAIPDNSICIWGLAARGTNDNVLTKTFGTAPYRQVWIHFNSYGYGTTASDGSNFTYWSIVLEETTNKIYIVDQRTGGYAAAKTVTAGVQVNSTTAWSVATPPAYTTALATSDPSPADNSYYAFIPGSMPAVETEMKEASVSSNYVVVPGTATVTGTIRNLGASPITSADVTYRVNGTDYTTTFSSLNIPTSGTYNFSHPTNVNINNANMHDIKVWVTSAGDVDHMNDSADVQVSGLAFLPTKRVLLEEGTGTWCQWCPRGAVYTEHLDTIYPGTAIVVAVHNNDPMADATYDAGMSALISGYPGCASDRAVVNVDPLDLEQAYLDRIGVVPPADIAVSANFDASTRIVDITVSAHVAGDLSGDYRLNAVLTEDDVTGTTSGYAQVNAYNGGAAGPLTGAGHDWTTAGSPVPAAQMHYNFVGRTILGGYEGQIGSMPASMTANNIYTQTFSYTVPAAYDASQMRVIGFMQNGSDGTVLNVNRGAYGITTAVKHVSAPDFTMGLYPNPATTNAQLEINLVKGGEFRIDVINIIGQSVYSQKVNGGAGQNVFNIPVSQLTDGVYMVRVTMNNSQLTQRLIVR